MSNAPYIPRFSDPRDIDEFVAKLEAFERGELSADAFRAFRLTRGVYGQRQPDVQMLRVKVPGGLLGKAQLEAIADVADRWSRGFAHVTTRQNFQLHFIKMTDAEAAMRRCDEAGLTIREACGNSVRNVTACDRASICGDAAFDVTPYQEAVVRYFLRHPLAATLPRKFKIAFSGCATDCAVAAIHDLGFIAKSRDGVAGFRVVVAGGLSTLPMSAIVLHDFVPAAEIARVGETILRLFDRLGNRENRHRARLKYVLKKLGEEGFRARYAEIRAEVDAEASAELKLPESPRRPPAPPVLLDAQPPGYLAWRAQSVVDQRQDGYTAVYVRLKLGDVTSAQMRALGPIFERFGDGSAYITIDQNILIPYVDRRSLPAIFVALKEIGLSELGVHTAKDVTSCPGAETCNLAVTKSRQLAGAVSERLEQDDAQQYDALKGTVIKVSGCPNSCGQHHIADIGFHGAAKKEGGKTYPMYQLHLGGGVDGDGAYFGRQVVKIVARRVPEAVVKLLALYQSDRAEGETPNAFFRRVDPKRVVAALGDLLAGFAAGEEADIGETVGFEVAVGQGECAA
ncbi:MAG: nitrite/sulfite reductase [Deltaproteobacteria bacterium]|nr:nitrite/sulfite reductase [Deltaproteobacteria bacterium]